MKILGYGLQAHFQQGDYGRWLYIMEFESRSRKERLDIHLIYKKRVESWPNLEDLQILSSGPIFEFQDMSLVVVSYKQAGFFLLESNYYKTKLMSLTPKFNYKRAMRYYKYLFY